MLNIIELATPLIIILYKQSRVLKRKQRIFKIKAQSQTITNKIRFNSNASCDEQVSDKWLYKTLT